MGAKITETLSKDSDMPVASHVIHITKAKVLFVL